MAARKQKQRRMSAQVVEDEDYQLRYEIVAGIDVAKETNARSAWAEVSSFGNARARASSRSSARPLSSSSSRCTERGRPPSG